MLPHAIVIDASVLVAGMRPGEAHFASARTVLELLTREESTLYIPTIALAEVAAAIARGTASTEQAESDVALVRELPGVHILAVDHQLGDQAAILAAHQQIRGCDAVYVGLAQSRQVPLLTLDRQQLQRTPDTVTAKTPAELIEDLQK